METPIWEWGAFVTGLIVGSFANVCIHRLPRGLSVVRPRSRCPACGAEIRAWQNVPVLSYLALRGRCATCRAAISARYPAVEVVNGVAYLALAARHGPSAQAVILMALVTALLVLGLIDAEHFVLPDALTLPGIVVGLLASLLPGTPSPTDSLATCGGGYLAMRGVAWAGRRYYGEEALGAGDWKLVAMLGAFLGAQRTLLTLLLGSVAGSLVGLTLLASGAGSRRTRVPLGTFLAAAGVAVVFAGDPLLTWYRGLVGA